MRLPAQTRRGDPGFNMTPMIDVVFLLIIFFLLSSHLARQESQLPLPLPLAGSGLEPDNDPAPRVTINVLSKGDLLLAGKPVLSDQLQRRLSVESAERGKQLEVRIRSDRSVPYRYVEPILLACAKSDIWNVTFAVFRPEDQRR